MPEVSAEDRQAREYEIVTLREAIIRKHASDHGMVTWRAMDHLLVLASVAAELPYNGAPLGDSARALRLLRSALEAM